MIRTYFAFKISVLFRAYISNSYICLVKRILLSSCNCHIIPEICYFYKKKSVFYLYLQTGDAANVLHREVVTF